MKNYLNRSKIAVIYVVIFIAGYLCLMIPAIQSIESSSFSFFKIIGQPFVVWIYSAVCGGCIRGNLGFAVWLSIPLLLGFICFSVKTSMGLKVRDLIISGILLALFLLYPFWFNFIRERVFDAGLFSEYFSYCCE